MPSMRAMMLMAGVLAAATGLAGDPAVADDSPDIAFAKRMFAGSAPKPKGYACFVRRYDAAHMAQHPLQKVTVMKLLITAEMVPDDKVLEYSFRLGVNFRDRPGDFDSSGDCGHAAVTKVPDNAETVIPAGVDISCGVDCDGGGVDRQPRQQRRVPDRQADRPHPHLERQEPRRSRPPPRSMPAPTTRCSGSIEPNWTNARRSSPTARNWRRCGTSDRRICYDWRKA